MNPQRTLAQLLEDALSPDELRDWLHEREGFLFFQALPDDDGILYREAAASLGRRARVDVELFEALLGLRPALREAVHEAAGAWGLSLTPRELPAGLGLMRGEGLPPPVPDFSDAQTRDLSMQLDTLYERREQAAVDGGPVDEVDQRILALRRKIRHGPHLHAGEFLDDGRYKLIEKVGQGGWGAVWKAYDRQRRALVAVKVLHGHWSGERSRRERFTRGAAAMFRVQHQAVVRVLREAQEDGGFHYFVMELLRGGDLHVAVLEGALPAERCVAACVAVGEALVEAHALGLVHRDIKPHNILLDSRGRARLTDFDLVKDFDYSGSHTGSAMGTYRYAAPELLEDAKSADARADVYGLGMTVAFCLIRQDPPREAVNHPLAFAQGLPVGGALRAVIERALQPDPALRWPTMAAFVEALDRVQGDLERGPERSELVAQLAAWRAEHDADEAVPIGITEIVDALSGALTLSEGDEVLGVTLGARLPIGSLGQAWWTEAQPPGVVLAMRASQLLVPGAIEAFAACERDLLALAQRWSGRPWSAEVTARSEDGLVLRLRLPLEGGVPWSSRGQHPWREALTEAAELCERLSAARASGVEGLPLGAHGLVVNPERPGEPVLVHALRPPGLVDAGDLWGEAVFAPPEGDPGERGLVYRVGRLLHAALLGDSPGPAAEADPWQDELSDFPPPVSLVVFKATAQAPEDRYSSLSELRGALLEAARWVPSVVEAVQVGSLGEPGRLAPPLSAGGGSMRRWRQVGALMAVAVVLVVVSVASPWWVDPSGITENELAAELMVTVGTIDEAEEAVARHEAALMKTGARVVDLERRLGAGGGLEAEGADVSTLEQEREAADAELQQLMATKSEAEEAAAQARERYKELLDEAAAMELPEDAVPTPQGRAMGATPAPPSPTLSWWSPPTEAAWLVMVAVEGGTTRYRDMYVALPRFAVSAAEIPGGPYHRRTHGLQVPQPDAPVTEVSFCDALRFANRLSRDAEGLEPVYDNIPLYGCDEVERITWHTERRGYRLPTFDEWVAVQAALQGGEAPEAPEGELEEGGATPRQPWVRGVVDGERVPEWLWDRCGDGDAPGRQLSPGQVETCIAPEDTTAGVGFRLVVDLD